MKLRWALSFAFFGFASIGLASSPVQTPDGGSPSKAAESSAGQDDLTETLVSLEKRSWEAWKNRDGKFFEEFLSDDHVDVHGGGPSKKAAVVAGVGSPMCVVKSYSVDRFTVTRFDADTALVVYRAEQDTTCGGQPVPSPTWTTSLYVRRGGRWWNAFFQTTEAAGRK